MTDHAILFDFWQTLFLDVGERDAMTARKSLLRSFLADNGYDGASDLDAAFDAVRPWFMNVYLNERRTPLVEERLGKVLAHLGIALPDHLLREVSERFGEMGMMHDPQLAPHAHEVLHELSRRFHLGIVSDTGYTPGRVLRRHMAKHGVLDRFSAFSFSDETGHAKPHPRQFLNVLNQVGVPPERAIHCGDLPTHDIRGAKALGITAVLYTGCHSEPAGDHEPDFVISDWRELPAVVDQVFG